MAARKRAKKAPANGARPLPTDTAAALRAKQALELIIQGHSYSDVAQICGYSGRSAAWTAVHRELARSIKPAADELRQLEVLRLDRYLAIVDAKAAKGDLWAIDRALKISEARRKLLGLEYAPAQVAEASQQRMYIIGLPDNHPSGAPLPSLALPAGVPQPGPNDYVRAVPQSALDAV